MGSEVQVITFVVLSTELDENPWITSDLELMNILFFISFQWFSVIFRIEKALLEIEHTIFNPSFEARFVLSKPPYLGKKGFRNDEFHIHKLLPESFRKTLLRDFFVVRIESLDSAVLNIQESRLNLLFPKSVFR